MYISCPFPYRSDAHNNMDQPSVWDQIYTGMFIPLIWEADTDAKEYFFKYMYFVLWNTFVEIILAHVLTVNLHYHHNNFLCIEQSQGASTPKYNSR